MFESLTERLSGTINQLRGRGRLTEENIQDTLREVRRALLEADVAVDVAREFVDRVRTQAVGQDVLKSLTPGQELVRVVRDELTALMADEQSEFSLNAVPPVVVLVAGLQGSGKTTSVAKLSLWLSERHKKSVMVASCDVYRPAAIQQLETLAGQVGADFFPSQPADKPVDIARAALEEARRRHADVLIVDTAGRLHVDADMMDEAKAIHAAINPTETLFVVDSMTGQDAANTSKAFNDALPLTGVILTKTDGDARGGAALSIRQITGKPIKFLGVGEKTTALEQFHADRVVSRILGMGDVLGLIEEAEQNIDKDKAQKLAKKLQKGKGFDLEDFRDQIRQMRSMGGLTALMDKLPGAGELPKGVREQADDSQLVKFEAIINSMTPQERRFPAIIKGSRKRRIAAGSGSQVQDVNRLLKQMLQMQKMMKRMKKRGGLQNMLGALKGGGGPPPGRMPF
ncbi:MAG: signal recognition particle protein [Gammaproteobacteria bacterium]|nr:signal recognition particle protein [Gammaproteobacteria bacterium]